MSNEFILIATWKRLRNQRRFCRLSVEASKRLTDFLKPELVELPVAASVNNRHTWITSAVVVNWHKEELMLGFSEKEIIKATFKDELNSSIPVTAIVLGLALYKDFIIAIVESQDIRIFNSELKEICVIKRRMAHRFGGNYGNYSRAYRISGPHFYFIENDKKSLVHINLLPLNKYKFGKHFEPKENTSNIPSIEDFCLDDLGKGKLRPVALDTSGAVYVGETKIFAPLEESSSANLKPTCILVIGNTILISNHHHNSNKLVLSLLSSSGKILDTCVVESTPIFHRHLYLVESSTIQLGLGIRTIGRFDLVTISSNSKIIPLITGYSLTTDNSAYIFGALVSKGQKKSVQVIFYGNKYLKQMTLTFP